MLLLLLLFIRGHKRSLEEQQATNLFRYELKIQTSCYSENKLSGKTKMTNADGEFHHNPYKGINSNPAQNWYKTVPKCRYNPKRIKCRAFTTPKNLHNAISESLFSIVILTLFSFACKKAKCIEFSSFYLFEAETHIMIFKTKIPLIWRRHFKRLYKLAISFP